MNSHTAKLLEKRAKKEAKKYRTIVTPEGLTLSFRIAELQERLMAFILDLFFMILIIGLLFYGCAKILWDILSLDLTVTIFLFSIFLISNFYFIFFELNWQGQTPGKKICRLRAVNRQGGELSHTAIIARNLTREVEFFVPIMKSIYAAFFFPDQFMEFWIPFLTTLTLASLPVWSNDHLRAGDLIGGTLVIRIPKTVLLPDLTMGINKKQATVYTFNAKHLSIYGTKELQLLEDILRRPTTKETEKIMLKVANRIIERTGWTDPINPGDVRHFLTDFYVAERAELERGQLFGHIKDSKTENQDKKLL